MEIELHPPLAPVTSEPSTVASTASPFEEDPSSPPLSPSTPVIQRLSSTASSLDGDALLPPPLPSATELSQSSSPASPPSPSSPSQEPLNGEESSLGKRAHDEAFDESSCEESSEESSDGEDDSGESDGEAHEEEGSDRRATQRLRSIEATYKCLFPESTDGSSAGASSPASITRKQLSSLFSSVFRLHKRVDRLTAELCESNKRCRSLELQTQALEERVLCCICYERPVDCAFTCGHVSCGACAAHLPVRDVWSTCPTPFLVAENHRTVHHVERRAVCPKCRENMKPAADKVLKLFF